MEKAYYVCLLIIMLACEWGFFSACSNLRDIRKLLEKIEEKIRKENDES